MDRNTALRALSALAQNTRLEVYFELSGAPPEGLSSGEIAERIGTPTNTMSTHLTILAGAGLISATRRGRHVFYHANAEMVQQLAAFLVTDPDRKAGSPRHS